MEHCFTQGISVRCASLSDINELMRVCKISFPCSLRWNGIKKVAKNWWIAVIQSRAAETWVLELDGVVSAFCVLIMDMKLWAKEKPLRKPSFILEFLSLLICPVLVAKRIRKRLVNELELKREASPIKIDQIPNPKTWIEFIAVLPTMRNHGFAKRLLKVCEARTLEMGLRAIGLRVNTKNVPAICLYETLGYVQTALTRSD
jgi:GNAT superfamily N-acetyltransferase